MTAVLSPANGRRLSLDELLERLEAAHAAHVVSSNRVRRCFPLADLYRLVGPLSMTEVCERTGVHPRMLSFWHAKGSVTVEGADRIACGLGWHPALVWPDWID